MFTVQSAILALHIAHGINPMDVVGMQRNWSYMKSDGTWVNPKSTDTLQVQLQNLYESEHSFVSYVASNPMGTQTRNGKKISSGKYMFTDEQVSAAIVYLPNIYKQYKNLGVIEIGAKVKSVPSGNDAIATEKLALLKQMFLDGDITAEQYNTKKALYENASTLERKTTNARINKFQETTPIVSNGNETIVKMSARKGKSGTFYITLAELKKHKLVAKFGETFTRTLVHGKTKVQSTAKWVITDIRADEISVKQYTA